jgi:O-acetyl-ADP-ribose deacetylase (regulator of RNase III)
MPIVSVSGDLFVNAVGAQALAHGCNCQGSMGAGVAAGVRQRYPLLFLEYRRRCRAYPPLFNPGDVFLWKDPERPWVFNLATQEYYGRRGRASYEHVAAALGRLRTLADTEGVTSIALPRIGTGYGGLSWRKVRPLLDAAFADWPGTLFVYEEYVPQTDAACPG